MTAAQLALDCEPTWDPEPDDEDDDGPYCRHPDLGGQGIPSHRFWTMTTIEPNASYL